MNNTQPLQVVPEEKTILQTHVSNCQDVEKKKTENTRKIKKKKLDLQILPISTMSGLNTEAQGSQTHTANYFQFPEVNMYNTTTTTTTQTAKVPKSRRKRESIITITPS